MRNPVLHRAIGPIVVAGGSVFHRNRNNAIDIAHLYYRMRTQWYRIRMSVSELNESARACPLTRRLGAMVYDGLVLVAVWMVGTAIVVLATGREIDSGNPFFQVYLLALAFAYFHASWSRIGQTLGMRSWRVWLDPGPAPFGLARSLLRFLAGLASLALLGIGFAWALARSDRRAWPDLASRSRLVYRSNRRSAPEDRKAQQPE